MPHTLLPELAQDYTRLREYFQALDTDGIAIAYSGGVDSTLLLKVACEASSRPVLAVILETELHPHSEIETAVTMAKKLKAECTLIHVDEFQDPQILQNPVNRCYLCKHLLFTQLQQLAHANGRMAVCDGTNKDDEKQYRPGMLVLKELGIHSPLRELGFTKQRIRELSAALSLPTASAPSAPCLATRLPYGAFLDRKLLANIHKGEEAIRQMGFYNVRLRYHEPVLRIEIDRASFPDLLAKSEIIVSKLKRLGFLYVTLDLEGFRSGSMDLSLSISPAADPS